MTATVTITNEYTNPFLKGFAEHAHPHQTAACADFMNTCNIEVDSNNLPIIILYLSSLFNNLPVTGPALSPTANKTAALNPKKIPHQPLEKYSAMHQQLEQVCQKVVDHIQKCRARKAPYKDLQKFLEIGRFFERIFFYLSKENHVEAIKALGGCMALMAYKHKAGSTIDRILWLFSAGNSYFPSYWNLLEEEPVPEQSWKETCAYFPPATTDHTGQLSLYFLEKGFYENYPTLRSTE